MSTPEAQRLEKEIQAHIATFKDCKDFLSQANHHITYRKLFDELQKYKTGELVVRNIVVTVGRSVLAQRLANTTTYTGTINYGALGSSSTAVTNADTQLGTEVFRKIVASASYTNNVAFIDFFYAKADTNGTYQEFGTFIDGSGSANSGQMFTHTLTGGWTKSSSESMTVSCQYSIN
jgi:aminoglycoside phosphotransferase